MTPKELSVLCNVLSETMIALEECEFQTRTGFELEEGEALLASLTCVKDNLSKA